MAKVVLRDGPKDGAYETVEDVNGTLHENASELHVPAVDTSGLTPKNVVAIYRRDPEDVEGASVWRYHRSEPVYRTK